MLGCKENPDCFDTCFFDEKQTKGAVFACFILREGLAPHPRFTEGESGRGVEKNTINLLLTFMNTIDLRLKLFNSKLFSKTCTQRTI
jgi:hypothetical protein